MAHNGSYWIPRTLDAPALILFFEADTAVIFVAFMMIFGMMNLIAGFFIALTVSRLYIRLKDSGNKGLIIQMLYWYFPSEGWMSKTYSSSVREYVGR